MEYCPEVRPMAPLASSLVSATVYTSFAIPSEFTVNDVDDHEPFTEEEGENLSGAADEDGEDQVDGGDVAAVDPMALSIQEQRNEGLRGTTFVTFLNRKRKPCMKNAVRHRRKIRVKHVKKFGAN
mmetsp:Transcript_115341/g.200823  ORF Transcript_115341/g.200823 Transcript_115341/m.200823 type:complete len:125 (-) Transcript_115341:313-687(-)